MSQRFDFSNQDVVDRLREDFALSVVDLKALALGADANAKVYSAETAGGDAYFVKARAGSSEDFTARIHHFLIGAGIAEVIPPIETITHGFSDSTARFTLTVYPFISGADGFSAKLSDTQWVELGSALGRIHGVEVPAEIEGRIRRETYSPKWREAVRGIYDRLEKVTPIDVVADKMKNMLTSKKVEILSLVERSEKLADLLQKQAPELVFCHSDIHAGNIMIEPGGKLYLIDWDDPIMAPKERDLMFIGGGIGDVWNDPREEKLFYDGYGQTEVNLTALTYYRLERIVEDVALYAEELFSTKLGKDRETTYGFFVDQFKPNGAVEIAFRTYDSYASRR